MAKNLTYYSNLYNINLKISSIHLNLFYSMKKSIIYLGLLIAISILALFMPAVPKDDRNGRH